LALHLGVKEIRILDATNYKPDFSGYAKVGLTPSVSEHPGIIETFGRWVRDPANAIIWNRDIGVWNEPTPRPFDVKLNPARTTAIMNLAHHKAREAEKIGEAPIGAAIVDRFGEVIGAGLPRILTNNDPTAVAAMMAWRACGARDHWKDKTLFLTCGPDHIAYSMFHVFKFGQHVVASDRVFAGQTNAVRKLGVAVQVTNDFSSDELLAAWLKRAPKQRAEEHLGIDSLSS
jgi:tRNA(Arg) A34 adenosine deaminase TadA